VSSTEVLGRLANLVLFGLIGWLIADASVASQDYLPWSPVISLVGCIFGASFGPYITLLPFKILLDKFNGIPFSIIVAGTIGLIVGVGLAALISIPFIQLEGWKSWGIPLTILLSLGALGSALGVQRERDIQGILPGNSGNKSRSTDPVKYQSNILVDTSAIIDGRIADVSQTGFVQGSLLIPSFVLDELRHIADSSDPLRRTRGRRGLEMLAKIQREGELPINIIDVDFLGNIEVDSELVSMAKRMDACILTTDFNLNRVAELQGVPVLNVNELANALKPVVLPGEELSVHIVQEGKEPGQGVAFLDDGTMVVVEGGRRFMDTVQSVNITRILQTSAGRIIFAQPRKVS
tara:strand:+ start:385 stop:1434 length:1050 start_codon:yes stop_codon:yes gene_type:complete